MTRETLELEVGRFDTPLGEALVVFDDEGRVRAFDWTDHEQRTLTNLRRQYPYRVTLAPAKVPGPLKGRLEAYFGGQLDALDGIPCETGGTPFQRAVWAALRRIRAGQTRSYGEVAREVGSPKAVRAVGLANGSNPIGVIVPCHRVIGSDGSLTGYGGGLERKRWLLQHEGAQLALSA